MTDLRLKFVYEHGPADNSQLDLYDGAVSLGGLSRALAITTHAFINGEIRTRGDAAHGAKFYLLPTRPGSFIFEVGVWMAGAYASGLFYDFVRHSFREAVGTLGLEAEPSRALQKRIEPTLGELPAVLESPLQDVHRPIREHSQMTVTVSRPRGQELITFNSATDAALQPRTTNLADPVVGNVTRYNALSRWGRFFDRSIGRVVSFFLDADISERDRSLITWSLHERNLNREGTLYLYASAVVTPSDHIKRYNVHRVLEHPAP